jgi:hypothetical protein
MIGNHPTHTALHVGVTPSFSLPTPGAASATPLVADSPEAHELLESLDDAMFAAIGGECAALESAKSLWFRAAAALDGSVIDESREQYLRYAAEVARRSEPGQLCDPARAVVVLEIIELLTRG